MPTIKTGIRFSKKQPLSEQELRQLHAYWRAANYLTACQLYLMDNPLLERPLVKSDLKQTIVGHWGTCPGQNFIYTHLDRVIKRNDLDMIYLSGPGHGGNAMVAQDWLDGSYTEVYPNITRDKEGMQKLFKRFSFPGGIPSHVAPETPGSIHEGGELGYSLAHAFGAVADNPDLIAACVVGDGEAETGPLATSWHGNKFVNPITDGAVLPILHLNGFKIANPTIFSRMSHEEVECFFRGCGWEPYFVEGDDPMVMHQQMAAALDRAIREIKRMQREARKTGEAKRPRWPMIVLRTPKGWTGPKEVDGLPVENCWRAHQVPISMGTDTDRHLAQLEAWLRSYKPEELFNPDGTPVELIASFPPTGRRRMGANPHANGGLLLRDLRTPDFRDYAVDVKAPGAVEAQDMYVLGTYVRDVMKLNMESRNFRIFAPDETASNRLQAVFEVTGRRFLDQQIPGIDDHLDPDGRVMDSMLSEHFCEGFLEGYLLTGRHGFFDSYEAFIRIVEDVQRAAVAAGYRLAELYSGLQRLAAGSQRLYPSGPRLFGSRGQQEGRRGADVSAAGCQLPAVLLRPLHPQPKLRQCHCGQQAPPAPVADHGAGGEALHPGYRHLELGLQRSGAGAGCGHGLLRRYAYAGDAGRREHPASGAAGAEDPCGERGGSDEAAAPHRAPPRPDG